MKNQYFGDVFDYVKYGLIRLLSGYGNTSTAVCWLLTKGDGSPDGHRTDYLLQPDDWKSFDPAVYEFLHEHVIERHVRGVDLLERSDILPNCRFYSDFLEDEPASRLEYFRRFRRFGVGASLVFFDPDNGMEVQSTPFGTRHSSKYLYWSEVRTFFEAGQSLLVYQHLPPKPREPLIANLVQRFGTTTGAARVYAYRTNRIAFFLIPQEANAVYFAEASARVRSVWKDKIQVEEHTLAP